PRCGTKAAEFRRIGPGEMCAGGIDLIKFRMQAKAVVLTKALEIMGAFDGRGVTAGIMIPHVHPRLVDIGCPHEGAGVPFQHQDTLPRRAAFLRRVQAIKPRTENDFIVDHTTFPRRVKSAPLFYGLYLPAM